MLAQNFLSHDALDLLEVERDSLVQVLGLLERRELVDEPNPFKPGSQNGFHMGPFINRSATGVAACIAGWANIVSNGQAFSDASRVLKLCASGNHAFVRLGTANMRNATVAQAAMALRNYLTTGEPEWDDVFAGHGLMVVSYSKSAPAKISGNRADILLANDLELA